MKLAVKNVKSFIGMEGHGFNATLYADGVKVAFVIDDANGGCYHFQWFTNEKQVMAYIASIPATPLEPDAEAWERELYPNGRTHDIESIVGRLVDDYLNNKRFAAMSKKKTLYRLPSDDSTAWRSLSVPFSDPRAKAYLDKNHPEGYTLWSAA